MIVRHFLGLLLGILVTPAVLFATGWAVRNTAHIRQQGTAGTLTQDSKVMLAIGAMALVGLGVGILLASRASPLATLLPAAVMLGWTALYVLDVGRGRRLLPPGPSGLGIETLLASGVYALLGAALLIPLLKPSRWRSKQVREEQPTLYG